MAPSFNSPKQELEQGICGQHGWSSRYFQAPSSRWCVEVRWGVGPRNGRVFVSDDVSDGASKAGVKKGHAAAGCRRDRGLRDIVHEANSKPTRSIEKAFGPWFDHTCSVMSGTPGVGETLGDKSDRGLRRRRGKPGHPPGARPSVRLLPRHVFW